MVAEHHSVDSGTETCVKNETRRPPEQHQQNVTRQPTTHKNLSDLICPRNEGIVPESAFC